MKWLKILIVKVAEFGNPSTKNIDRQTVKFQKYEVLGLEIAIRLIKICNKML